jgi:hypothetical protein
MQGKKLSFGKRNKAGRRSASPLRSKGNPADSTWMNLTWIEDNGGSMQKLPKSGLYKILSNMGRLLYVGKSNGHLISRARSHIRTKGLPRNVTIWVSAPRELRASAPVEHHFLELENDLIAGYYARHKAAPMKQFFKAN